MDGTVCDSKQIIGEQMLVEMKLNAKNVIIISGQSKEHMDRQLAGLECTRMPQSGNITDMWINTLTKAEAVEIYAHINKLKNIFRKHFSWKRIDHIDNRGCQISLSFMGHDATYEDKIGFDPDRSIRKKILQKIPFVHQTLSCTVAGTTCLDYTKTDGKKGNNIKRYIDVKGWDPNECIYFGDALFKGGNDESVIGVIDTVEVSGPDELLIKLKKYGA